MATSAAVPLLALRAGSPRIRRIVSLALTFALLAGWFVALRPQSLGGPAAYVLVSGTSMLPGLNNGDLVVVHRQHSYERGDVVSYRVPDGDPAAGLQVIHRITGGNAAGFDVQGDNRDLPDLWRPAEGDIVGEAWLRVPYAGYALAMLRSPAVLASLAAALAAASIVTRRRKPAETSVRVQADLIEEEHEPESVPSVPPPAAARVPAARLAVLACVAIAALGWRVLRSRA